MCSSRLCPPAGHRMPLQPRPDSARSRVPTRSVNDLMAARSLHVHAHTIQPSALGSRVWCSSARSCRAPGQENANERHVLLMSTGMLTARHGMARPAASCQAQQTSLPKAAKRLCLTRLLGWQHVPELRLQPQQPCTRTWLRDRTHATQVSSCERCSPTWFAFQL